MPKYMIVRETSTGWECFSDKEFYNSVEAATDAAITAATSWGGGEVAVAEVIKRFSAQISIKEVKVK